MVSCGTPPKTWTETAQVFGTTMHPLAQWQRIVRAPYAGAAQTAPDGREFRAPNEGVMQPTLLATLVTHLVEHTSTPDDGVAAIWDGFGGLVGFTGDRPSRVFFEVDDDRGMPLRYPHETAGKRVWQDGILSREISEGPRLESPGREYVLFSAGARAFADPRWVMDAPWRDREAEGHGFAAEAQHPNILWPGDHAWVMVSEIDFDSTVVAGSARLIAEICADDRLEAMPIAEDANLTIRTREVRITMRAGCRTPPGFLAPAMSIV